MLHLVVAMAVVGWFLCPPPPPTLLFSGKNSVFSLGLYAKTKFVHLTPKKVSVEKKTPFAPRESEFGPIALSSYAFPRFNKYGVRPPPPPPPATLLSHAPSPKAYVPWLPMPVQHASGGGVVW